MLKAPTIWQELVEAWEAKMVGATADADAAFEAAKKLAARRGFRYLPAAEVAKLPLDEVLRRVEAVAKQSKPRQPDVIEAAALLGGASPAIPTVGKALEAYWSISDGKITSKSKDQIRRWENPRKKAIAGFIKAVADLRLDHITTEDLYTFRSHLTRRVAAFRRTASFP